MSNFKITEGKGFSIKFANAYRVSVQFGPFNYCENYGEQENKSWPDRHYSLGQKGSLTAETALLGPNEKLIAYDDDNVQSHMTPEKVLELLNFAASIKDGEQ